VRSEKRSKFPSTQRLISGNDSCYTSVTKANLETQRKSCSPENPKPGGGPDSSNEDLVDRDCRGSSGKNYCVSYQKRGVLITIKLGGLTRRPVVIKGAKKKAADAAGGGGSAGSQLVDTTCGMEKRCLDPVSNTRGEVRRGILTETWGNRGKRWRIIFCRGARRGGKENWYRRVKIICRNTAGTGGKEETGGRRKHDE